MGLFRVRIGSVGLGLGLVGLLLELGLGLGLWFVLGRKCPGGLSARLPESQH